MNSLSQSIDQLCETLLEERPAQKKVAIIGPSSDAAHALLLQTLLAEGCRVERFSGFAELARARSDAALLFILAGAFPAPDLYAQVLSLIHI